MATFSAKKLELTQVNGGQEYEQGDFLQSDTINDVVEGTAYAQNVAEAANTTSNNAVSTANSANKTANAASAKVDTFDQRITTAQNTADTAVSNAATAQSTADSATTEINKIKNGTTVVPNANHANNADNANLATKAQQDVNGNPINTTYATREFVAEQQGTRVKVNNVNVAELSFTSDPQTQITANKNAIAEAQSDISDIVDGSQTVGKAKRDANGNVIDTTYALLPTSVTNTDRASGQWVVGTGATPATGKTMLLGTFSIYDTNIWLRISGGVARGGSSNYTTDVNVFISSLKGTVNEAYCYVRKLYKSSRTTGIYYTVDSSRRLRIYAAVPQYGKMFVSAEVSGGAIVDKGSGEDANPTGGQYIPEKNYFATDPSKLEPSTANGWTQTTATGSLPSSGVYMVSFAIQSGGNVGTGILVFGGSLAFTAIGTITGAYTAAYYPSASTKWSLGGGDYTGTINAVYYKRIA